MRIYSKDASVSFGRERHNRSCMLSNTWLVFGGWFETAVALFVHGLNDLPKRQAEAILQSNQWTKGKFVRDPKQRLLLSKLPQLTAEYLLNDVVQQQQQQQQQQKMKPTTIPLSVPIVA